MSDTTARDNPPMRHGVRGLAIVARGQPELWQALKREVGDSGQATVLLDRRQTDRRQGVQPVPVNRRQTERRRLLGIEEALRVRHHLFLWPDSRRSSD